MILVTVGTEKFPFNRLMRWLDAIAHQGFLQEGQEDIIVQYGSCTVLPAGARVYPILPEAKFFNLIQQARLIIAHCGEGTINLLVETQTPYILVPRSHAFGEHVDNHQIELADALSSNGIPIARSPGDLVRFLADPQRVPLSTLSTASLSFLCQDLDARFGRPANQRSPLLSLSTGY